MALRIRATAVLALAGGAAVAIGVRLLRQANTPPPEPIGDPVTSSWRTAGWIGLAVALLIATCVWICSVHFGFFDGEDDQEDGGDENEQRHTGAREDGADESSAA